MVYLHLQRKLKAGWSRVEVHRIEEGGAEPVSGAAPLPARVVASLRRAVQAGEIPDAFAGRPTCRVIGDAVYRLSKVVAYGAGDEALAGLPTD